MRCANQSPSHLSTHTPPTTTGNKTNEAARKRTEMENQSPADVIQIGGCRDDQTSADARINGTPAPVERAGALCFALSMLMGLLTSFTF